MTRLRLIANSLTLFEDEDAGYTRMAIYLTVRNSSNVILAQFKWNNAGNEVDEVNTYPLDNDPGNISAINFELDTFGKISVEGYADDDEAWPNAGSNENSLGSADIVFDPRVPATLGSIIIGPTQTDNGNTGYLINVNIAVVAEQTAADVRIKFEDLILFEDEEAGSTRMAIYVQAKGPGIDQEIFRWNNGGAKVNEVNAYGLDNSPNPNEITLLMTGPTAIIVKGYADDDEAWPNAGSNENSLGTAMTVVDPSDPTSAGQRQIGATITDNDNKGYLINVSIDILPATPTPNLSIAGIEVTQAIQHFHSTLGQDNSVPLVANKLTLVRVYLDSGVEPSINGGLVPNVSGLLTANGNNNFTLSPIISMTSQPLASVDPKKFTDTLNFLISPAQATGNLTITVQASVDTNVSNPESVSLLFHPVGTLNIIMVRVQTSMTSAPTRTQYFTTLNQLPLIYPIPTDPSVAIQYWFIPGSEVVVANHDLTTQSGMEDFLDDLEDIQEDSVDYKKLYGLVSNSFPLKRTGISSPSDNVAFGWSFIMESIGHELGHIYGLDHAPCGTPGNMPEDPDDEFIPSNGRVGEVGVDPIGQVAFNPSVGDFMSYCGSTSSTPYEDQWISAYHWNKLFLTFGGL